MTTHDFNNVALFIQIVRAGSFVAASQQSGIPANTISRRMQQLETDLGVRLLHRSTRKLSLTAAGQEFFDRCSCNLDHLEEACAEVSQASQVASGVLRVAASADFFDFTPMTRIREFMLQHPLVRLEFMLDDADADLIGGAVDVAIRATHLESSSLVAHRLVGSYHVLVASPAYLRSRGEPQGIASLKDHHCIARTRQTEWRLVGPNGAVTVSIVPVLSTNTVGSRLSAALTDIGVALLPISLAAKHLASGALMQVLPDFRVEHGGVYLVYPTRRQRSAAVCAFAEFMLQTVEPLPLAEVAASYG